MPPPVLGIDLGTTNSVVAIIRDEKITVLCDEHDQPLYPSVVTLSEAGTIWTGREALALGAAVPGRTAYAVKRLLGRKYSDTVVQKAHSMYPYHILENPTSGGVLVQLGDQRFKPESISAMVLKALKDQAARRIGAMSTEAVITVPAYFNHSQREATQRAATEAGLKVLRLLNEPTAAALSLGSQKGQKRVVAVYDFGGGTFDISIIRIHDAVYEVLSTDGDTFLGGDDIDGLICDELSTSFENATGVKLRNFPLSWHRLRDAAEKAKKELSTTNTCGIYLPRLVGDETLTTEITLKRLEELAAPLIERSLKICERALEQANLQTSQLDNLILVGGQSRMPLLRRMVEEFFAQPPAPGVDPDTAVAEGAAREAAMLRQGKGALLLDVTPMTLGINIVGNRLYPLIQRNTKLPVRKEHLFTTHRDAQTRARMVILQGENPAASENVQLGEILLTNLRSLERFRSRIKVAFEIDANGILHVKALDEDTGEETDLVIHDSFTGDGKSPGENLEVDTVAPSEQLSSPTLSGPFVETEFIDVLCFLHANRKTGRIEVSAASTMGTVMFAEGQITHAAFGQTSAQDALSHILRLKEGHFAFQQGETTAEPKQIDSPFESLLRELA